MSTRRNGDIIFTGFQTVDYQKENSTMDLEESQIRETTNEMDKVGTSINGLYIL
jgi:hypothetical protein